MVWPFTRVLPVGDGISGTPVEDRLLNAVMGFGVPPDAMLAAQASCTLYIGAPRFWPKVNVSIPLVTRVGFWQRNPELPMQEVPAKVLELNTPSWKSTPTTTASMSIAQP